MSHPPKSPFFHPHDRAVVIAQSNKAFTNNGLQAEPEPMEHKSGLVGCTSNMMTCIVGSGIVGIPYAVKQAGFGAGLCLILLVGAVTEKSLRLLVETAKHVHTPSYETAAEAAFGVAGFRFILANMFVIAFGAMVSYLMIVKDSFSVVFKVEADDTTTQNLVLFGISFCIQLPLACLRDMADLDKTSRLAVLIDMILVGIVAYTAPWTENLNKAGGIFKMLEHDTIHYDSIFVGLGVLSFAFECQESAFLVAGSLSQPTRKRWSTVTMGALIICVCLALVCGTTGYVGYLKKTQGNILNNFDHSWAGNVAHGMLGATMFATYPLASFVARHVCVVLLFEGRRAHEGDDTSILNRTDRRIALTVALYILALILAAYCQDFGAVLALAGVVGGSCIAYVGPGMLYLGVHGGRFLELVHASWFYPDRRTTSVGANITQPTTFAVETTPLVASRQEGDELERSQQEFDEWQRNERRSLAGLFKTIVFYLAGFPIWCKIAAVGKKTLTGHIHTLVSRSPHPIRIGDVQFSLVKILEDGKVDADPDGSVVVSHPDFMQQYMAPLEGSRLVSRQVASEEETKHQSETGPMEPDPQEQPPSWLDFIIAISYILFGVIALFAGLFSLYYSDSRPEPEMAIAAADTPFAEAQELHL